MRGCLWYMALRPSALANVAGTMDSEASAACAYCLRRKVSDTLVIRRPPYTMRSVLTTLNYEYLQSGAILSPEKHLSVSPSPCLISQVLSKSQPLQAFGSAMLSGHFTSMGGESTQVLRV